MCQTYDAVGSELEETVRLAGYREGGGGGSSGVAPSGVLTCPLWSAPAPSVSQHNIIIYKNSWSDSLKGCIRSDSLGCLDQQG